MADNTALLERNKLIVQQLSAGAKPLDVASTFNLSVGHVRHIHRTYAAPTPVTLATNGNGNKQKSGDLYGELGLSGLKHQSGWIFEEFIRDLDSSAKRARIYNEMRSNDPVVGSMLLARELVIRGVNWRIEGDDKRRSNFIESAWQDLSHSWNDHVSEVLSMDAHGWAWFEKVFKRRRGGDVDPSSDYNDGRIGWRKFALRSQDSLDHWEFDDTGNVTAMLQRTYPDFQVRSIPLVKSLLYRTSREKNNPEGRSPLRPAYTSYYYAKNLRSLEAIGAERDLAGLPHISLPEGADHTPGSLDIENATKLVRRVHNDEQGGLVTPFGWDFKLEGSPGSKQFDVGAIIQRYETRIAMSMLATFLMMGMDKVGSYSLSKNLSDFFVLGCSAEADIIAETFSQYAIPQLLKLNGMKTENAPKLVHDPPGTPDLEAVNTYLSGLTNAGIIHPDVDLEQWTRDMIGAPKIPEVQVKARQEREEEEVISPPEPPPPPPQNGDAPIDENGNPADVPTNGNGNKQQQPEKEVVPA